MIDHFDLFGLRQVLLHWRGQDYALDFKTVRHPLMLGLHCRILGHADDDDGPLGLRNCNHGLDSLLYPIGGTGSDQISWREIREVP